VYLATRVRSRITKTRTRSHNSRRVSTKPTPTLRGRRHADDEPSQTQPDHHDVPPGSSCVEEREVETVEPVIQPPIDSCQSLFLPSDDAAERIKIQPRVDGVIVLDPEDGKTALTTSVVVVGIVDTSR
jgi:hypothetical protein